MTATTATEAKATDAAGADVQEEDLLLEHQLCFALTVAARSVVGAYKPVLEKLNLTHPQYLVMLCLWEDSPRTVRNISEALAQEPATISPLLRRLEAADLITRQRLMGHADPKTTEIYDHLAMRKVTRDVDRANPLAKIRTPASDLLQRLKGR